MKNIDKTDVGSINWQQHIDNYCNSEKSKSVYCADQGLHLKQFEYHYRRWYENLKEERENETNPTPAQFLPVIVKSNQTPIDAPASKLTTKRNNSGIELQLVNGVRCKVEADFCKVTLKQVMELVL